jgi:hypothetical protein
MMSHPWLASVSPLVFIFLILLVRGSLKREPQRIS